MSEHQDIERAFAAALPAELRPHAAELATLLGDLAVGLAPADLTARLTARPVLGAALAALVGQTLDVAGRPLHIAGNVGTLQQIMISGGYVERIIGTAITIQLPPAPRVIDPVAAQELLAALPLDAIPPVAPLPELHRMPFARNPLFVGREADLLSLALTLKGEGGAAAIGQAAAATGIGGIGKTNLATEFVHRYGQFFAGGVFWLSFADPAGVPGEIAACGAALDLPGLADLKLDEQVQRVQAAWAQPLPRLLVFDNCDDTTPGQAEALIQQWRPTTGGSCVLITSRRATWSKSLGVTSLSLGVLSRAESIALLRKHRPDLAEDDPALDAIAAELGDLPLALHLAGSFLETYRDSHTFGDPAGFLRELRDQRLLDHDALQGIDVTPSTTNHDLHVARTFTLSYERLDTGAPVDALAIRLLARATCLAPGEPIPRALLLATLDLAEDDRVAQRQAEQGLHRLVALGLLDGEADGALRLHRLLAGFVLRVGADEEAQGAVEQVLRGAMDARLDITRRLGSLADILAHLRWAAERALARDDVAAALLANNVAYYLMQIGEYAAARPLYERALQIREQILGPTHPDTASSYNNLAELFRALGDYATAYRLSKQALMIREQTLGPTHPDTATSVNNLASSHHAMGNYAAAQPLYERALQIREQALGPTHPDTATSVNNLAELLRAVGDYTAARPLYERALAIYEQALGPTHSQTVISVNNLAALHYAIEDYAAARPLYERALQIREQTLGPIHPQTATSVNNLAALHYAIEDYATARPLYERALQIREQVLGLTHPDTAGTLNNLAELLRSVGNYDAAHPLYERALGIRKETLGPFHPATAQSLNNLAINCYYQDQIETAADLMRRALSIREQRLGPDHPATKQTWQSLVIIQHRLAEGKVLPHQEAHEPPEDADLRERAEAAVACALAEGSDEERAALAEKLRVTADAYAGGQPPGSPAQKLAADLRALAERLEA